MKITNLKRMNDALERLAETPLRGTTTEGEKIYPYKNATLSFELLPADVLSPAQSYVLSRSVYRTAELWAALKLNKVDMFHLASGIYFGTEFDEDIPLLPPIVEVSREVVGGSTFLVNDGMHRIYTARKLGYINIGVILAENVPSEYPYYAYPLPGGWSKVREIEDHELTADLKRKEYRRPDDYKFLFRDFNSIFPGIQEERKNR